MKRNFFLPPSQPQHDEGEKFFEKWKFNARSSHKLPLSQTPNPTRAFKYVFAFSSGMKHFSSLETLLLERLVQEEEITFYRNYER